MLFNSLQFTLFFIIVYILYLVLNHKWQNRMLLVASYVFYGLWDWRFLSLILASTIIDYFCGIKIDESNDIKKKKIFLLFSLIGNLSILGVFKYFNFFAYNLQLLLNHLGFPSEPHLFHIILPVGISFYTFKTMTYTITIYWGQMKPNRNFLDYALFLAFFPALLSGPIDRANSFLPQISSPRKLSIEKFYEGCFLIFWGLFQKIFIADNLAKEIVNPVFAADPNYQGAIVLFAMYAYVFQLYCDFAGYTNIAIGLGKVMGFNMMNNFNLPLFATNVADFWRRWHISLSTWVRDYIYTPLFMSLRKIKGNKRLMITTIITMILLGLWHGAGWNFIVYGLYYGVLLVIYQQIQPMLQILIKPQTRFMQHIWLIARIIFMFHVTALGFLIFRAQSISQIYNMLYSLIANFQLADISLDVVKQLIFFSWIVVAFEIIQYRKKDLMFVLKWNTLSRAVFYFVCFYLLIIFGVEGGKEFIYFQF